MTEGRCLPLADADAEERQALASIRSLNRVV